MWVLLSEVIAYLVYKVEMLKANKSIMKRISLPLPIFAVYIKIFYSQLTRIVVTTEQATISIIALKYVAEIFKI